VTVARTHQHEVRQPVHRSRESRTKYCIARVRMSKCIIMTPREPDYRSRSMILIGANYSLPDTCASLRSPRQWLFRALLYFSFYTLVISRLSIEIFTPTTNDPYVFQLCYFPFGSWPYNEFYHNLSLI
jgi:hypothetical protein